MSLAENKNPIVKRIVVLCKMQLLSPALVGSGEEEYTARDVYVDAKGNPVLPGTSLAGVLRNVLDINDAAALFGSLIDKKEDEKTNKASPLWVYDAPLYTKDSDEVAKIITIDNVRLEDEEKIAASTGKFDFQAVDRGSRFDLRLQLIIRRQKEESEANLEALLDGLLEKLNYLYIGGKTSRGFGKLVCVDIYKQVFYNDPTDLKAWLNFNWHDESNYFKYMPQKPNENGKICAILKLNGTLLIRDDYSVIEDEETAQITSDGIPVIYGTSWAGAIRGGLNRFLKKQNCKAYFDKIFGCSEPETSPSKIRIDASYFGSDKRHNVTRVKIDRWTGGAVKGALFTSRPQFGGSVRLTIYYPPKDEAIRQLIILALQAIDLGIITVGGETSVGRGVFKVKKICINGEVKDKCALFKEKKDALKLELGRAEQ